MSVSGNDDASRIPAGIGQAACGIVHDLSNLIQTIILRAEVTAATEPISEACAKRMDQIVEDGQGGANLIRSLLEYARKIIENLPATDLRDPVKNAVEVHLAASGMNVELTQPDSPLLVRQDARQIVDMISLLFSELAREAEPGASFTLSTGLANPEGNALNWMNQDAWVELRAVRNGKGSAADLEEGHLQKAMTGAPPSEHALNLMRIRGIVRQHKGQLRILEEVEDTRQSFIIEIFLPLGIPQD